jgi:cytochrome c-type biogenesis protein CcmH
MMKAILSALLIACVLQFAHAFDTAPAFDDPQMQRRYDHLIRELRCLQCRNYSIADSDVSLAADMRRQVRELMAEGKSDQEIKQYMAERFGDYVLYNPPLAPRTWLLWSAPVLFVLIGGAAAIAVIRRKARLPHDDAVDPDTGAS